MSLTTDRNHDGLKKQKENGQNETYLVLSDEELAKGFVRPVRKTYIHVGKEIDKSKMIPVDEYWDKYPEGYDKEIRRKYKEDYGYRYFITYEENDTPILGRYITESDLKEGCGFATEMNVKLAETYAANPKFYGATFCVGCGKHLAVEEFVWDGTNERVGS